ncbi:universal stress protein [Shewanella sp. 0m-11]
MRTKQILCPTDFSETASHAIGYAIEMATFYKVGICLLHVVDKPFGDKYTRVLAVSPDDLIERMEKEAAEKMKQFITTIDDTLSFESAICHGHPVEQILLTAEKLDVGMIVMASHGRTGLAHFLNPNTTEDVVCKAHCPVLVVK